MNKFAFQAQKGSFQPDHGLSLEQLDNLLRPIKLFGYVERITTWHKPTLDVSSAINQLRETLGKAQVIFNSVSQVTIQCDMKSKPGQCFTTDFSRIYMSHDVFTCKDMDLTKELLAKQLAYIIRDKVFGSNAKHFHWQLIYYMMGFDPLKEINERNEANKLLEK